MVHTETKATAESRSANAMTQVCSVKQQLHGYLLCGLNWTHVQTALLTTLFLSPSFLLFFSSSPLSLHLSLFLSISPFFIFLLLFTFLFFLPSSSPSSCTSSCPVSSPSSFLLLLLLLLLLFPLLFLLWPLLPFPISPSLFSSTHTARNPTQT